MPALTKPRGRDWTGERFSRLVVVGKAESGTRGTRWLCRCDCGGELTVDVAVLRKSPPEACRDCLPKKVINLVDQQFGKLVVLSYASANGKGEHLWNCVCDCGKEIAANGTSLRHGRKDSCGCGTAAKFRRLHEDNLARTQRRKTVANYKKNATLRGLEWSLSDDEAFALIDDDCAFCMAPPSNIARRRGDAAEFIFYNGIDRIDNDRGYEPGNVQSCCYRCNYAKRDMSVREFLIWAHRIAHHTVEPPFDSVLDMDDHDVTRHPALRGVLALYGDDRQHTLPLNLDMPRTLQ